MVLVETPKTDSTMEEQKKSGDGASNTTPAGKPPERPSINYAE
jgi:hypothetical protein